MPRGGGLLMRVRRANDPNETDLVFVSAQLAHAVATLPPVTRVPGAPEELVGVTAYEGEVVPVVSIGPSRSRMVIVSYAGETLAIVGADVVASGIFDDDEDVQARYGSIPAILDVSAIYARLHASGWARRLSPAGSPA